MSILLNELASQYISTYITYHTRYSKICLLMQVGLFYEILEVSNGNLTIGNAIEISELLQLTIAQKYSNQHTTDINPYVCGFPVNSSHTYISKLLENEFTVVVMKQYTNRETNVVERVVSNVYTNLDEYY